MRGCSDQAAPMPMAGVVGVRRPVLGEQGAHLPVDVPCDAPGRQSEMPLVQRAADARRRGGAAPVGVPTKTALAVSDQCAVDPGRRVGEHEIARA